MQLVSCLSWTGNASPSALFELARSRFENLAPKFLYQEFFVNFFLVLISIHSHLLYPETPVLLLISSMSKPSTLRQTNPKNWLQNTCPKPVRTTIQQFSFLTVRNFLPGISNFGAKNQLFLGKRAHALRGTKGGRGGCLVGLMGYFSACMSR